MTKLKSILNNKFCKIIVLESGILLLLSLFYLLFYHIILNDRILLFLPSGDFCKKTLFVLLILFVIYDIFYYHKDWTQNNLLVIFGIFLIAIFTSLPLFMRGISLQQDLNYHLLRIQTMTDCLKSGQFPVRMNAGWMGGYGYPDSIFYGNLLLYLPVVFEFVGFKLYQAYKIYAFTINLLTAIFSYICAYTISKNKSIGIACAFAYTAVPYRLTLIYINEFVGFYSGITFFPLVVLSLYKLYTCDLSSSKTKIKISIMLALSMSGLILTHILSTLLATGCIFITSIILFKKTFKKDTITTYVMAILETFGLSCYFIVPFLDYYINVPIVSKSARIAKQIPHIKGSGVNLLQLFGYNVEAQKAISYDIAGNEIITWNYSIGLVYILLLIICISLLITKRASRPIKWLSTSAFISIWISTCYFPWDYLSDICVPFRWLSVVQFAWRYLSIVNIVMFTLLCLTVSLISEIIEPSVKIPKNAIINAICLFIASICISQCCNYASDYAKDALIFYFADKSALQEYETLGEEYLLDGSSPHQEILTHELASSENIQSIFISQNGCHYQFECANSTPTKGWVEIPIFNYKGYKATDNISRPLVIENGNNNVIKIIVPENYSGTIDVDFKEPIYWRISEIITLISAFVIMMLIKNKKRIIG